MRLVWLNDLHLNFVKPAAALRFAASVAGAAPDAVLVGGDTGESDTVLGYLDLLADVVKRPIYFVLGNHDFYRGSISGVRATVARHCRGSERLAWLNELGPVTLTPETCLVGHDGWADGRFGDFFGSRVDISDYRLIAELIDLAPAERLRRLNALGDEAAAHFREHLPAALETHRRVVVLTHVPPFLEASVYDGKPSDADYAPHFACRAVGEVLAAEMERRGDRELLVLCGHTHGSGRVKILPNLEVITGGAHYGRPRIQQVLEV